MFTSSDLGPWAVLAVLASPVRRSLSGRETGRASGISCDVQLGTRALHLHSWRAYYVEVFMAELALRRRYSSPTQHQQ